MRRRNLWSLEMKRRTFIKIIIFLTLLVSVLKAFIFNIKKINKSLMAKKPIRFPGKINKLQNISAGNKWRG